MASTKLATVERPTLGQIREELFKGTNELTTAFYDSIAGQASFTPEQETMLADYMAGAMEKRDNLAAFIHRLEHDAEYLREREKQLADSRHSLESLVSMFKGSIKTHMECMGAKKVEGMESRFSLKANPPKVEITDESAIPGTYVNYVAQIDKRKIADDLAAGKEIPGARFSDPSTRIEIK